MEGQGLTDEIIWQNAIRRCRFHVAESICDDGVLVPSKTQTETVHNGYVLHWCQSVIRDRDWSHFISADAQSYQALLDAKRRQRGDDDGCRDLAAVPNVAGGATSPGSSRPAAIGLAAIVPDVALQVV